MLTITINVETAQEAREQMRELLGLDRETAAPEQPVEEPKAPKATRGKSKPEPEPAKPAGNAEPTPETKTSDAVQSADTATSDAGGAVTKEDLAKKATAYGQKAGPDALKQLFVEAGSAHGKFSEVPPEKYGALAARLDDLIAG